MKASLATFEWQQQESPGNHAQAPACVEVQELQRLPARVLGKVSFNACLGEAARHSGKDDCDLAQLIRVSPGYMSKLMRAAFALWASRLVDFMRVTHSHAPLQWIAHQVGCDVVPMRRIAPARR